MLSAIDYLDDGSPIALKVTINEETGDATFDFTGTGPEVRGNLNAPISVVHSAIIYCMRAMVNEDIPLNAGCLVPLDSRYNPSDIAYVQSSFLKSPCFRLHRRLRFVLETS